MKRKDLPWKAKKVGDLGTILINAQGIPISNDLIKEDAEFIAQAVNNYEPMKEMLNLAIRDLEDFYMSGPIDIGARLDLTKAKQLLSTLEG